MHRAGKPRLTRIGDIVLAHLAGAAAGGIEKAVVHREIDIGDERRHGTEALQERRQPILFRGFGRGRRRLLDVERAAFTPIEPSRLVVSTTKPYSFIESCAGRTSSVI